jgi:hypothetical protein
MRRVLLAILLAASTLVLAPAAVAQPVPEGGAGGFVTGLTIRQNGTSDLLPATITGCVADDCETITFTSSPWARFGPFSPGTVVRLTWEVRSGWNLTEFACTNQSAGPVAHTPDLAQRSVEVTVPASGNLVCRARLNPTQIEWLLSTARTVGQTDQQFPVEICREGVCDDLSLGRFGRVVDAAPASGTYSLDVDLDAVQPWQVPEFDCDRAGPGAEPLPLDADIDLEQGRIELEFVEGQTVTCVVHLHTPGLTTRVRDHPVGDCAFCQVEIERCAGTDCVTSVHEVFYEGDACPCEPYEHTLAGATTRQYVLRQLPSPGVALADIQCEVVGPTGVVVDDPATQFTVQRGQQRVLVDHVADEWSRCTFFQDEHRFADTNASNRLAAEWAYANGYLGGYPGNRFRPELAMTRARVARLLWLVDGRPAAGPGCHQLTDVPSADRTAICWLVNHGHAPVMPGRTFRPSLVVTRAAFARMVWHVEGSPAPGPGCGGLIDVSGPARRAICWLVNHEFASGLGNRYLQGRATTRADAARILFRLHRAD